MPIRYRNSKIISRSGAFLGSADVGAVSNPNFSMSLDSTGTHFVVNQNGVLTNWADVRRAGFDAVDDAVQVATVAQGTGNDAQAFQTAITTALNSTEYGNGQKVYIYVPDGNYTIATTIDITSSRIRFKGQSVDGVVIDAAGNDLGTNGIFHFHGSAGGYVSLGASVAKGDTSITVSSTANFADGDYLMLQKRYIEPFYSTNVAKTETLMAAMSIKVNSVDPDGVTLHLSRPVLFDVDHTQGNRVYHSDFITDCGLHNLTLVQSTDLGSSKNGINHLSRVEYSARFWLKNCKINRPLAHPIRTTWIADSIFEDSTFDNCWARGEGGGNGYYGPQTSTDCLYRNCHLEFLRHLACEEYSYGNLIDNITARGVDLNFHKQFPAHNIFQRIVINDDTEALTLRGEANRDIYSTIVWSPETTSTSALSVLFEMNGIWNCDFQNMSHGGCCDIGGAAIDFNLEWSRFQYEGDAWSGGPEPWVSFGAPGIRESYANNIVFKTQKNMDSYAFFRNPNQHNGSAVPEVTFRGNTLYNFALAYQNNNSEGVTDIGNTWVDNDLTVPSRPTPPVESLAAYQLANHGL